MKNTNRAVFVHLLFLEMGLDDEVHDGSHGALFLHGDPFQLLQLPVGDKRHDTVRTCQTTWGFWSTQFLFAL